MTAGQRVLVAALAAAVGLAGCSGDGATGPLGEEVLSVQPGRTSMVTADTVWLRATADGVVLDASEIAWSTSDASVADVDARGVVSGVGPGTATISAATTGTNGSATGTARFSVVHGGGQRVASMAVFDSIIPAVMARWGIPGGAVAVAREGRLVLARGYGLADQEAAIPVRPDALFRVASVSKPVTAVATLKLHEQGSLDLDLQAFELLADLEPPEGTTEDERLSSITVRHLLHHAGGWDRNETFDPMFRSSTAADAVGAPRPASAETVIRYMRGQPLQFNPGSGYSYSNLGYAVLGRVIERVSGRPYEAYVRDDVLAPMGIHRMRIGGSRLEDRVEGEVRYYDPAIASSVFPGGGSVPIAYGGFHLEAMDANGAWVASVVDLVRFASAVDSDPVRPDVLEQATIATMIAPPPPPLWTASDYHYGMGWLIRPVDTDANWWHDGSLPGTTALLVRAHNGLIWAVLFNARSSSVNGSFAAEIDSAIWQAVDAIVTWPLHDLFTMVP